MRLSLVLLCLAASCALGGCDTGAGPAAQGGAATSAAATTAGGDGIAPGEDRMLVSAAGERAQLSFGKAGSIAPTGDFAGLDGRARQLADFRGKPLLVNLWATWCAPCVREMPTLDALATRYAGRIAVVPVAQDLEGADRVRPWFAARRFTTLTSFVDPENRLLMAAGGNLSLPLTILYDGNGRELWRVAGGADWTDPEILALIDRSIAPGASGTMPAVAAGGR